jgi:hypothetical protein
LLNVLCDEWYAKPEQLAICCETGRMHIPVNKKERKKERKNAQ